MQYLLRGGFLANRGNNTNQDLVQGLRGRNAFTSEIVERALLTIPRGCFVTEDMRASAYSDEPLRFAKFGFNISAPHMYAMCLEKLELEPGNTVLDIGSGCGHFTALAGWIVGKTGLAHGLDIRQDIIDFAVNNVKKFSAESGVDLSNVHFFLRNCFLPDPNEMAYDRIHVGACCPESCLKDLYHLLAPNGILVTPYGDRLIQAKKDAEGNVKVTTLMSVRYGDLIVPSPAEVKAARLILEKKKARVVHVPSSVFISDFCGMVDNSTLHDVCLVAEGTKIFAHKFILKLRCPYLRELILNTSNDVPTIREISIDIPNLKHNLFINALKHIYSGDASFIHTNNVMDMLDLSKILRLDTLQAACEAYVQKMPLPPNTIFQQFGTLLNNPQISDLTILADGHKIFVHKFIVGARSKHFLAMMKSGMRESRSSEIQLHDQFKYPLLMDVMKFVYTEDTSIVTGDNVVDLLDAANFLDLHHLKCICEHMLHQNIDVENVSYLIQVAHRYEAPQLKSVCFEFIFEHYEEVVHSKQFAELDKETILLITCEACKRLARVTKELTSL